VHTQKGNNRHCSLLLSEQHYKLTLPTITINTPLHQHITIY